jgi:hypothetical protein
MVSGPASSLARTTAFRSRMISSTVLALVAVGEAFATP